MPVGGPGRASPAVEEPLERALDALAASSKLHIVMLDALAALICDTS